MGKLQYLETQSEHERQLPNEQAQFNGLKGEALSVFTSPNLHAKLKTLVVSTGKSYLETLELINTYGLSIHQLSLTHPDEMDALHLSPSAGPISIEAYFGYDPKSLAVQVMLSGSFTDLITNEIYALEPIAMAIPVS